MTNEMKKCPYCNGRGEFVNSSRVRWNSIDPSYITCPLCLGIGEVSEDLEVDVRQSIEQILDDRRVDFAFDAWAEGY